MRIIFDHALLYGCDSSEIFSPVMQENDAEYVKRRHTKGYNTSHKKIKNINIDVTEWSMKRILRLY